MRGSGVVRGATLSAAALVGFYGLQAATYRRAAAGGLELQDPPAPEDPAFPRLIEALTTAPLRPGNRVSVLRDGCEIFPAMLAAIRDARATIDFATYVYWSGDIAPQFADALAERATAGVEVNILLDAVGASKMDRALVARLEDAGAHVAWFRPPRWYTLHKLNNRTHRKILVVDGRVGFTGGVGIAEEWTGNCEDSDHWRDTHLRVEGPGVRDLFGGFQENWAEASGLILTGPHLPELAAFDDGVPVQVTRSSASGGSTEAEELFFCAIRSARRRLWVTNAYFAPRRAFVDALGDAVARGVDVRLLVNGSRTDKEVVRQAGRVSYDRLLDAGVRIFEYQQTMLHAKVLTVDGVWATVGSINFDNRSFALNDELNLSVTGPDVVARLDDHFLHDLEASVEIEPGAWRRRPLASRARELASGVIRREL